MSNQPERPDWPCGCPNDHRMAAARAWCGACSEWCYPEDGMLCARGEAVRLEAEVQSLRAERGRREGLLADVVDERNATVAALRFSEREWRNKAQDKTAEVEELLGVVFRLKKAEGAARLLAGWQKPPCDSPEAGEAFMLMVEQARAALKELS